MCDIICLTVKKMEVFMETIALILAAGKGTRMISEKSKVMHKVNGVPMIKKIDTILKEAKVNQNIYILGYQKEKILDKYPNFEYVEQKDQLGTGHAVMQAENILKDFSGIVLILCGDTPLLTSDTIDKMIQDHKIQGSSGTILTAKFDNPYAYGRIVKDENGNVMEIVEEKDASETIKQIKEINTGVYCFNSKDLQEALKKINNKNSKGEYYLTDVIKIMKNENKKVKTVILEDNDEVMGINNKVDLANAEKILRDRKNKELMEQGVIMIDPNTTYIENEVQIGIDTVVYPNVVISGDTSVGKNCIISSGTRIENSTIGNNVKIDLSVIEEAEIDEGATIGPFAHLRPKSKLEKNVHVGNFVETKKATLKEGGKAGHLTYIGDAEIGEATNIGAGTITCNYDGKNKFQTKIGKNVFVGSNTKFVAPVVINDNVYIGAGSTITKDVKENSLAIARARQKEIENWANRKKK